MTTEDKKKFNNVIDSNTPTEEKKKESQEKLLQMLLLRIEERKKDEQKLNELIKHLEILEKEAQVESVNTTTENPENETQAKETENNGKLVEGEASTTPNTKGVTPTESQTNEKTPGNEKSEDQTEEPEQTETRREYEELWSKLKSIKPWQPWKIVSFVKTLIAFRSVEKELKKEVHEEEMEQKYGHMAAEELFVESDKLKAQFENTSMWNLEMKTSIRKEMEWIVSNLRNKKLEGERKENVNTTTVNDGGNSVTEKEAEATNESEKGVDELRAEFANNQKEIKILRGEWDSLVKNYNETNIWKLQKRYLLSSKIKKVEKDLDLHWLNGRFLAEKFEEICSKKFPLAYYTASKIKDPEIRKYFTEQGLRVKNGVDRPYVSFAFINNVGRNEELVDPIVNTEFSTEHPSEYMKNAVSWNIYGFSIRMLNKNEVTHDENGKYNIYGDDKAKYAVVDQNGKVLISEVNYNNAEQIYFEASEKYRRVLEEEFNETNKE